MDARQVRIPVQHTIFNAGAATGWGTALNVTQYQDIVVMCATASSANLTVEFYISCQETQPTWASAAAQDNIYDLVVAYDLADETVTGTTDFVVAGTDDVKQYLISVDNARWLNCRISARSAGNVDVIAAAAQ